MADPTDQKISDMPEGTPTDIDFIPFIKIGVPAENSNQKISVVNLKSGLQGPQGFQGAVGAQGSTGAQGNQGNQGDAGADGPQGFQGAAGAQGSTGAQGTTGAQGSQGAPSTVQGPQGDQGVTGAQGPQGTPSTVQGPQGDQGADGDEGPQGSQGFQGTQGAPSTVQGPQGDQGDAGAQGAQGMQGAPSTVQGPQGDQGDAGDEGLQGPQGFQGTQGAPSTVQGPQGNQGYQGNQGNQGVQGAQGAQGAGNQTLYTVQGSQVTCAAQTVTNIFSPISVNASTTYEYYAVIGMQPAAGTQGVQMGIQCSVAGATIEGKVIGPQTTSADKSYRQTAQGVGTLPIQNIAGAQSVILTGIIITPAGSPTIGVQAKGVQSSQAWYAKANCFLRLIKTS